MPVRFARREPGRSTVVWARAATLPERRWHAIIHELLLRYSCMDRSLSPEEPAPTWPPAARASDPRAAALIQPETAQALAETFQALGDPTRVRMLDALSRGEMCVGELAALLRMTESAISHQLRLLRGLRIVRARRQGRLVFYALDDAHVVRLFAQGLEHVQERHTSGPAAPSSSSPATGRDRKSTRLNSSH